jgi:hypothetical protein
MLRRAPNDAPISCHAIVRSTAQASPCAMPGDVYRLRLAWCRPAASVLVSSLSSPKRDGLSCRCSTRIILVLLPWPIEKRVYRAILERRNEVGCLSRAAEDARGSGIDASQRASNGLESLLRALLCCQKLIYWKPGTLNLVIEIFRPPLRHKILL